MLYSTLERQSLSANRQKERYLLFALVIDLWLSVLSWCMSNVSKNNGGKVKDKISFSACYNEKSEGECINLNVFFSDQ